jgi:apolipoprotein N-acyltransferase
MCVPWWGYFIFKNKWGKNIGYVALISFWMLFEYIHLNWQLSWPWLTLGNAFAENTNKIQWYEYTGVSGGTLWILLLNILMYENVKAENKKFTLKIIGGIVLVVPFLISIIIFPSSKDYSKHKKANVVIVQPNIDPYQKFNTQSISEQIQLLVSLSEKNIDSTTQLIIWPETAMPANVEINEIDKAAIYQPIFQFINRHPNISLLSGIETNKNYGFEKATITAQRYNDGSFHDDYNAAVMITANESLPLYFKSKLVPGVETLPTFLNFMAPVFEKFGGTVGGYAKDTSAKVLASKNSIIKAAPIICYESIYGEYVSEYVHKGANMLTIITNDGWWGNTPGHKQHLQYARLRAVETRRFVVRSANTGISAVINEKGNILETQPWNKSAVIKYAVPLLTEETFYTKHGDYLYKLFSVFAIALIVWNFVMVFFKNKMLK